MFDLRRGDYGAQSRGGGTRISMGQRPGLEGHHSVGTYGASTAAQFFRAVNRDHYGRGWLDTFYNTLVWTDGTVGEGRPHATQSGSVRRLTVCLAGNYENLQMTSEMRQSVIAHFTRLRQQGLANNVGWHGQRAAVACPGRNSIPFWRGLTDALGGNAGRELGSRVLRLADDWMRGDDVREWQNRLNVFLNAHDRDKLTADGVFGPATAEQSAWFMAERMGVTTDDPRVGPRTIEALAIWTAKHEAGKGRDEPDYIVAVCAASDVDEGAARVLGHWQGWKYLRMPEQVLDYRIGTLVVVGGPAKQAAIGHSDAGRWDQVRELVGDSRQQTTSLVERRIRDNRGDSRTW